jgi:hypothetical protein
MLIGTILLVIIRGRNSNTRAAPSKLEVMLKDFIGKQNAFNKSVEEKLG